MMLKSWESDVVRAASRVHSETDMFKVIERAGKALGFDFVAYMLRLPLPFSNPKTVHLNNYPPAWRERYESQNYVDVDPAVLHCSRTQLPVVWSRELFLPEPRLWEDMQLFGLRIGWAQSGLNAVGVGGMLTLARSNGPMSAEELGAKEMAMSWLVHISHLTLSRLLTFKLLRRTRSGLTTREVEVLRWAADGKTSAEISNVLSISENTVNFHIKNAVLKLETANKTAAVVRAAMLGLLTPTTHQMA